VKSVRSTDRHRMSPRRAAPAAMRARCTQAAARERLQRAACRHPNSNRRFIRRARRSAPRII